MRQQGGRVDLSNGKRHPNLRSHPSIARVMNIRQATPADRDGILGVHALAFPESERDMVAQLAADLLAEQTTPHILSLVAEIDGVLAGHVGFSPVFRTGVEAFRGYILAPLGVRPDVQKRGVGSELIRYGLRHLADEGVQVVFVYGDPAYYGRFGFSVDTARPYTAPYPLQMPFGWQALALNDHPAPESPALLSCVESLRDSRLW